MSNPYNDPNFDAPRVPEPVEGAPPTYGFYDPDSLEEFGGARRAEDLKKVPAVLALAARLHFEAGLRADVAVSAAAQQHGIGYCRDRVETRLYELGLAAVWAQEQHGDDSELSTRRTS